MIILIGSQALSRYIPDVNKNSVDLDIVGEYDECNKFINNFRKDKPFSMYPANRGKKTIAKWKVTKEPISIVEAEIAWPESSSESLVKTVLEKDEHVKDGVFTIPSLDFLYTLKMSHRYLKDSPHFLKTMQHIRIMRSMGAKIRPEFQEFLKLREHETYWYKHPKLNVEKKDFFDGDGVPYEYDHDSIHESMKHLERPAYTYYMVDGEQVLTSRKKWDSVSEQVRLFGALEEIQVLALERSYIPFKDKVKPEDSFKMAAIKAASSITSGYFREFIWENFEKIMGMYEPDYTERFETALANGIIKPFTGKKY